MKQRRKPTMKPNALQPALALMLVLPLPLLPGCAALSQSPASVPAPAIPPLPPEARQPPLNPICDPTCSERLRIDYERWRKRLQNGATGVQAASGFTIV